MKRWWRKIAGIDDNIKNITGGLVAAYLNSLYRNENPQLDELRKFAEEKHVPIVLRDTENLLMGLLMCRKPERVLEIGTAIGYSACCMVECCGCDVTTIESDEQAYNSALTNIASLGFEDKIEVKLGDARDVMLEMANDEKYVGQFDVVFIDAAKSHYLKYWELAMPLTTNEPVILCDNVLMKGMTASDDYDTAKRYKTSIRNMREFINYVMNLDYAFSFVLPVGDGVLLSMLDKTGDTIRDLKNG